MKKIKTSKRFRIYKEMRREMIKKYPQAFPAEGKRSPLKVGIMKDILAEASQETTANNIRIFLSIWTRSTAYLQSVAKKRPRINLSGQFHAEICSNHAKDAEKTIIMRKNKKRDRLTLNN
jgi:sRNA-binding protein